MPNYLTPGVYVEEVPSSQAPIEGVGTSVAAFVGLAPHGPLNEPQRIAGWADFAAIFGGEDKNPFMEGAYLAHAVYGFFENGGQLCWVVRVGREDTRGPAQAVLGSGRTTAALRAASVSAESNGPISVTVVSEDADGGTDGERKTDAKSTFTLDIKGPDGATERLEGLKLATLVKDVNARSALVRLDADGAVRSLEPGTYKLERPAPPDEALDAEALVGDVSRREGMGCLAAIDEVTIVSVPDAVTLVNGDDSSLRAVHAAMLSHCEGAGDRMAILDPPPTARRPQEILEWRLGAVSESKYAALYYPWVLVRDPITKKPILVPPSGHVAGIWARSDGERGVHKAPANEVVRGATGLDFQLAQAEQGQLNREGINCIRTFPGRGPVVWGARTLSKSDPEWRYLNVRRLFNFVSESIMKGTQWAVFEPNDERLWLRLRVATSSFLTRVWRDGALFGATPAEAFYVKCDAKTNRPEDVDAGRVTIEVGISPVKPAEFVVFQISQFTAGAAESAA
jgi:phage tail sheath protein FI